MSESMGCKNVLSESPGFHICDSDRLVHYYTWCQWGGRGTSQGFVKIKNKKNKKMNGQREDITLHGELASQRSPESKKI